MIWNRPDQGNRDRPGGWGPGIKGIGIVLGAGALGSGGLGIREIGILPGADPIKSYKII